MTIYIKFLHRIIAEPLQNISLLDMMELQLLQFMILT